MEREIYFYILHCVFFYNLLGKFNDKDSFSIVSQNIDARRNCAEKNEFDSVFYVFYVTRIQLMIQEFIFQLFSKISIETLLISLFERRSNMFRITHFECDLIPPIKLHQYLHSTSKNHECLIESNFARTSNTPIPELFFQTAILCWLRWRFWRDLVVFSHDPTILQLIIL